MNNRHFMNEMKTLMNTMDAQVTNEEAIRNTPVYRAMLIIKKVFLEKGLSEEKANALVSSLKINVNEALFEFEQEGIELTKKYAEVMYRIYVVYEKDFPGNALNFAKDVSFEYKA